MKKIAAMFFLSSVHVLSFKENNPASAKSVFIN